MTSLTCSAEDVIRQWKVDDCVNIRNVRWRTRLTPHCPRFVARSLTQTTAWSWLVGFANCGSCAKTRLSVKVSLSIGTCVFESLIAKVLTFNFMAVVASGWHPTFRSPGGPIAQARGLDWIVHCFTSPPTQYRLYGRRFLQVKRPNQQYQSTEGRSTKEKENNENN